MKISGRNLSRRLQLLGNRLSRIKYRKGHGVHSPFVYALVRKVFMVKKLFDGTGTELYDLLVEKGVNEKSALQLHNLMHHIGAQSYSINDVGGDLAILLEEFPTEKMQTLFESAKRDGEAIVVCQPYANRERQDDVKALIEQHPSTSVDNRTYVLFFFSSKLPKQHYRL